MIILFPIIFIFGITISYLIFSQSGVDRFWVVYLSLSIYIYTYGWTMAILGFYFFSQIGYRVFLWTWTRFVIVNNKIVLFLSFMGYIVSPIHWRQISYANLIFLFFRVRKRKKKNGVDFKYLIDRFLVSNNLHFVDYRIKYNCDQKWGNKD